MVATEYYDQVGCGKGDFQQEAPELDTPGETRL